MRTDRTTVDRSLHFLIEYAWRSRQGHILAFFFALFVVCCIVWLPLLSDTVPNKGWWDWAEPIAGISTLVTALGVWIGELRQDWENNLPKRLTVHFQFENQDILVCRGMHLPNEGDIRALSQQIGSQMTRGRQQVDSKTKGEEGKLKFDPFIKQREPIIVYEESLVYKLYTVFFKLSEEPAFPDGPDEKNINKYLVWTYDVSGERTEEYLPRVNSKDATE